jgi:hypothetical protein
MVFGKLFFAVAPFLNNSLLLAGKISRHPQGKISFEYVPQWIVPNTRRLLKT